MTIALAITSIGWYRCEHRKENTVMVNDNGGLIYSFGNEYDTLKLIKIRR